MNNVAQEIEDTLTNIAADIAAETQLFMETAPQISEDIEHFVVANDVPEEQALEIKKAEYIEALDRIIKLARHAKSSLKSIK